MFHGQNPTHDNDRERANSVAMNLVFIPKNKIKGKYSHIFNKKKTLKDIEN
jgi:hypothetical protein